ncbi:MAG: hypothetical protein MUD12_00835 [Spirochaetes bacterium]|jgi:hypothetical protein|nr:hypothetical protein [Spirochaetota bacterium]
MIFNLSSRLLFSIISFNSDEKLNRFFKTQNIAISPLVFSEPAPASIYQITLKSALKRIQLYIALEYHDLQKSPLLNDLASAITSNLPGILNIILKKKLTAEFSSISTADFKRCGTIFINTGDRNDPISLMIILSNDFLRFFSNQINSDTEPEKIDELILKYFMDPSWMMPELDSLLSTLDRIELSFLVNNLLKENLLSTYQMHLILLAYPEHSLKIKKSLSENNIRDIINFKKNSASMKITSRDVEEGIYSVEESIYHLCRIADFSYSSLLKKIQVAVDQSRNAVLLFSRGFDSWLDEMINWNLLYNVLSVTEEKAISDLISLDGRYECIFRKYISEKKINGILSLKKNKPGDSYLNSQVELIHNYRKIRAGRVNVNEKSFDCLVSRIKNGSDIKYLLLETGWFILSTAMKGATLKTNQRIINNIPRRAGYLIEDVLKGTVNPNIIHDEIQIGKAKRACMKNIIALYKDGIIELENM